MGQDVHKLKNSFFGSVGAGIKSMFGGRGRRFYTLVHKTSGKYHKAGESQRIILDKVTLGRASSCQVRFDESFPTVSRRHAMILKTGDVWKLVQLSQTNSTFVNGLKIQDEWYLQNGDEIQLSVKGPKLGFILVEGEKGSVKSIRLTARLNLFVKQAIKPYKVALISLISLFLLITGAGGYFLYETIQKGKPHFSEEAIEACLPHVYSIQTTGYRIKYKGKEYSVPKEQLSELELFHSGIGFLLDDGRFVTARRVVEPWAFWRDAKSYSARKWLLALNGIANNGGEVVAEYSAVSSSSSGQVYKFSSEQFTFADSRRDSLCRSGDGLRYTSAIIGNTDYAYMTIKKKSGKGLKFNSSKSQNLTKGENVLMLGFSSALKTSVQEESEVVALDINKGMIIMKDYEQWYSGAPVFCLDSDKSLSVVGIVSAGIEENFGAVVPISAVN